MSETLDRNVRVLNLAESMSAADASLLAQSHLQKLQRDGSSVDLLREMGLNARANAAYRQALEQSPEVSKQAKDSTTIGEPMPKAEWAQAKQLAGANGRVYLPKMLTDYAGKVVMVTDTHVVQQASKNSVIAHDLQKLAGREELDPLIRDGKLQGKQLNVAYGSNTGEAQVLSFSQVRANEVRATAERYAETALKTPQARETFLKHVEQMMQQEMERNTQRTAAQAASRQQPREQERSR